LEAHIRQYYSTLYLGRILILKSQLHNGTNQLVEFEITALKPENAVFTLNTDIEVEIIPLDLSMAVKAVQLKYSPSSKVNELEFNISTGLTPTVVKHLEAGSYDYYKIKIGKNTDQEYQCELKPLSGDCDLFVSYENEFPCMEVHSEANVSVGKKTMRCKPNTGVSYVYISVRAYFDSKYNFFVKSGSPITEETKISTGNDSKMCMNCKIFIPLHNFQMHGIFCARNYIFCQHCDTAFKSSESHSHCADCVNASY
jgi:hypothetical protein